MEIDSKKTALDDEASIYKKRKNTYTKEDIKEMSGQDKFKYFKEYYLKIVIIAVIAVIAIGALIYDVVFNRSQTALYVSCVNECQIGNTDEIATDLKELIKPANKNDIVSVVPYDLENVQFNMSFVTLVEAGSVDLVVCPYDYFVEASGAGYFTDLSQYLPEETYTALSDRLLNASLVQTDMDGNIIDSGEPTPFGIDISDNDQFASCTDYTDKVVLCVVDGSKQPENTLKAIEYFVKE